jgi:hypothetical protein
VYDAAEYMFLKHIHYAFSSAVAGANVPNPTDSLKDRDAFKAYKAPNHSRAVSERNSWEIVGGLSDSNGFPRVTDSLAFELPSRFELGSVEGQSACRIPRYIC